MKKKVRQVLVLVMFILLYFMVLTPFLYKIITYK